MSRALSWVPSVFLATVMSLLVFGTASAMAVTGYDHGFGTSGKGIGEIGRAGALAVTEDGDVWVVDTENDRVEKFNQAGEFLTYFGSHGFGPRDFTNPSGIDIDSEGNIWIADSGHSRIMEFDEDGEYLRTLATWGKYGSGRFYGPRDVAVDAEGDIWVADTANERIVKFDGSGNFLEVVNPAGLGSIEPANIAVGPEGVVWVSDLLNDRIVAFSEAGALLHKVGSEGSAPGRFNRPYALDVDGEGNVWVEDEQNERVQEFSGEGEFIATFGSRGQGAGRFSFPEPAGIVVGPDERFWISNSNAPLVQVWGPESRPTCTPASGETRMDTYTRELGALRCVGGGPVSYELVSGPEHGEISELDSETGDFWYYPEPGYVGEDPFTFTATNGVGSATPTTFDMSVGLTPECRGYSIVIPAGRPYRFGPGSLPCEGEGALRYGVHVGVNPYELQHGKLSELDPKTGSVTYTPEPGYLGSDFFSFTATNRFGDAPLDFIQVSVKNLPTCEDGSADTTVGESFWIELHCEGEGVTEWQIVSGPQHGELFTALLQYGLLVYYAEPEYEGTDSFSFKMIGEAGDSEVKTFKIAIAGPPPGEEGGGSEGEGGGGEGSGEGEGEGGGGEEEGGEGEEGSGGEGSGGEEGNGGEGGSEEGGSGEGGGGDEGSGEESGGGEEGGGGEDGGP